MSVLKCITNQTKRFHTFESNRLTVIHSETDPLEWNYINRKDNPADDGSKGTKVNLMVQNDRWLTGPKFLKESESEWPRLQEIPVLKDMKIHKSERKPRFMQFLYETTVWTI